MTGKKHDHCPACGFCFDAAVPKSPKQHRAFFHMVWLALTQWPEAHAEFQPEGATHKDKFEHLRAWLLCKAKYRRVLGERLTANVLHTEAEMVQFAKALVREARSSYCFPAEYNGQVVVVVPKSMAEITHEDFQPVFDEVLHLIQENTGIKVEFIKRELRQFA